MLVIPLFPFLNHVRKCVGVIYKNDILDYLAVIIILKYGAKLIMLQPPNAVFKCWEQGQSRLISAKYRKVIKNSSSYNDF